VCLLVITVAVILSPSSLPIPSPTTLGRNIPRVLFPREGTPPSIMGARRRNLRLARGSADSGCLRADRYLHHVPPRPHPASHPHNTLACNHSSLPPPSVLPPPHTHTFQHIIFCEYLGPRLCVRYFVNGARSMGLLHIHTSHSINTRILPTSTRLAKVYKGALVVLLSSPHQRAFVCGACIGTA